MNDSHLLADGFFFFRLSFRHTEEQTTVAAVLHVDTWVVLFNSEAKPGHSSALCRGDAMVFPGYFVALALNPDQAEIRSGRAQRIVRAIDDDHLAPQLG
ncbi:hypothetical protein [Agrobacterium tumefaciens]|uniref:hypothetical protein n=1 Tax=Agrobacterium tumefaciens TaxID=358 RepID=UPI0021D36F76|nr:hypothetical protein [Agrobacterium tumefaciens]